MLGSVKAALSSIATTIKSALPTVVAATTATVVTSGCIYYYTIKDGIYEKNADNVRYALEEYISQVTLDSIVAKEGGGYAYSTNLDETVQKIMDGLEEAGSNIAEYTGKEKEKEILEKLIKAEIITQYPDLRKASEIGKKVDNNELQGGIKIIRKDSTKSSNEVETNDISYNISENDKILTYIPYNDFTNKINKSDESVKQYFSLKTSDPNSTSVDIVVAGWTEETTTVKTVEYVPNNDGTGDERKEPKPDVTKKYNFNEISINYQNSLSKYSMPAGFLWSLLVMGENVNFVDKLANLAIDNTNIIIEAQDNISTTVNTSVQKYTCKKNVTKIVQAEDGTTKAVNGTAVAKTESSVTTTVETQQSNTSLNIAYAETWVATYKINFKNTINNDTQINEDWQENADWQEGEDVLKGQSFQTAENANEDKEYEDIKQKIIDEISEEKCKNALIEKVNSLTKDDALYYLFKANTKDEFINNCVSYMYNYVKGDFTEKLFENDIIIKPKISLEVKEFWKGRENEVIKFYDNKKIDEDILLDNLYKMIRDLGTNMITMASAKTEVIEFNVENKSANYIQTINTNTYTSAGSHVLERTEIDKENNFVAYFNKSGRAKEYILSSPEWVYEMLESHEKTANMIDLFKYLLYKATDVNYGVTSFDFEIIDRNNGIPMNADSSWGMFIEWLKSMEGHEGISKDGKNYIVGNVEGNRTVGYGVDLDANSDNDTYLKALGYNTGLGAEIPIEVVDKLMEQEVTESKNYVDAATSGLNLTIYQKYALYSRAYNCGGYGAIERSDFVNSYKKYWSDELTKENYKKQVKYDYELYSNCMNAPTNNGLPGLIKRREYEWQLFSTGYFHNTGTYISNNEYSNDINQKILNATNWLKQNLNQKGFIYHNLENYDPKHPMLDNSGNLTGNAIKIGSNYRISCATFVTETLYHAGLIDAGPVIWATYGSRERIISTMKSRYSGRGLTVIEVSPKDAKPGDILMFNTKGKDGCHTCILTGINGDTFTKTGSPEFRKADVSYPISDLSSWIVFRVVGTSK